MLALALMGFLVWRAWSHPYQSERWGVEDNAMLANTEWRFVSTNALGRGACLAVTLGLLWWLARRPEAPRRWLAQSAVVACLFVDVVTHVPPQNPSVPASAFAEGLWEAQNRMPPPRLGEGRMFISPGAEQRLLFSTSTNVLHDFLGKRLALWSNLNLLDRAPKVNGSSTLQLREQAQVQALLYGTNAFGRGLIEMLGVTWFSPAENPTTWVPITNACALISGGQAPVFAESAETLRALASADFDPHAQVYLRPEDRGLITVSNSSAARVHSARTGAHEITAEVEAAEPSLLVVAQSWCRGWSATVDGKETPLLRANHAFQAMEVPAGRHVVRLAYREQRLGVGALVTLIALAGCGWYWFRGQPRVVVPAEELAPESDTLTPAEVG
jgi:hypothetical protein